MRLGIEKIATAGETDLLGARGLRFRSEPAGVILTDPGEKTVGQFAGFGSFLASDQGTMIEGEYQEALLVVTDRRVVHVTLAGTVGGSPVSAERAGNVFVIDSPLSELNEISVLFAPRALRKPKPAMVSMASDELGIRFEPVVDLTSGNAEPTSDPWAPAQRAAEMAMLEMGLTDADRGARHQSYWVETDRFTFDLEALRSQAPVNSPGQSIARAAAAPVAQTPAVEAPASTPDPVAEPAGQAHSAPANTAAPAANTLPVLPVYVVVDSSLVAEVPEVGTAVSAVWNRAASAAPATLRTALVTMAPQPTLDTVLAPPLMGGGIVAPQAVVPRQADTMMFLADLLDHDLTWFKDNGSPLLRPVVLLLTGSAESVPDSSTCRLTDADWNFRPNLIVIGGRSAVGDAIASIAVSFSAVSASGSAVPEALDKVWDSIVESAQLASLGEPAALRFPDAIAGFTTRTA